MKPIQEKITGKARPVHTSIKVEYQQFLL